MTTTVITSLPELGTIADITYIPVETSGVTQKISGLTIKNYVQSALTATATTSLNGNLTVGGKISINGNATITGFTSFEDGITVAKDVEINGNLTVNRTSSLRSLSATDLTISGISILPTISATNLDVTNANVTTLSAINLTIGSTILPSGNTTVDVGNIDHWFGTIYGVSSAAKYADLAEKYTSDAYYEPGTVVSFGEDTEVTISKTLADSRVAGVVTTNPAYLMNAEIDGVAIALVGRVPCKVIGRFKRGDMLVTSDMPGVATYCGTPQLGTVIGKALESYDNDTDVGIIEVVVGRL